MAIQLNADQEQVIVQAIEAGLIRDAEDVVEAGVEAIRRALEALESAPANVAAEDWSHALHAWVHGHSTATPPLPDEAISRESIYGMRGL